MDDENSVNNADVASDSFSSFGASWITDNNDTEMFLTIKNKSYPCCEMYQEFANALSSVTNRKLKSYTFVMRSLLYMEIRFTELNKGQEVAVGAFAGQ